MSDTDKKTILIVEDEEPLLNVLSDRLADEGFEVLGAHDGAEGFALASKHRPQLILLDIIMPRVNGLGMLKVLRQEDWGQDLPVVVLTNVRDSHQMAEATELGVSGYLVKANWKLDDVVVKVKEKLGLTSE